MRCMACMDVDEDFLNRLDEKNIGGHWVANAQLKLKEILGLRPTKEAFIVVVAINVWFLSLKGLNLHEKSGWVEEGINTMAKKNMVVGQSPQMY